MTDTLVSVTYSRQVSDGNYGSESAEVHLEGYAAVGLLDVQLAKHLLEEARDLVHDQLSHSGNATIRRLFTPRTTAPPPPPNGGTDEEEALPF